MGSLTNGCETPGPTPARAERRPVQRRLDRVDCRLVYRPDRRRDGELPDCVNDAQPNGHTRKIVIRRELIGSFGAFCQSLVAVAREHQVGDAPDVNFRYHALKVIRRMSIYG